MSHAVQEPEPQEGRERPERTDATIDELFPGRGDKPSDEVVVDENADEAPNVGDHG